MSAPDVAQPAELPPLTETEIAKIEGRANAATPGPWSRRAENGRILAPDPEWLDVPGSMIGVVTASRYPGQEGMVFASNKDAAFILGARSDVPRLLTDLRRAHARIAELEAQIAATAEAHREDQRRADELAGVPG